MTLKNIRPILAIAAAAMLLATCAPKESGQQTKTALTIFAAAGTRPATEEICNMFEQQNNCSIARNYASSGTLARQIANGAECDVFISANRQWIDFLLDKNLLEASTVANIAATELVIIAPLDSTLSPFDFKPDFDILAVTPDKLAMGDPAYVPVGKYTVEAFEKFGWSEKLKDKIVMAKDVSSVLHYVELGECDWGVVFRTEALKSSKVKIISQVPAEFHKPIMFFAAPLANQAPVAQSLARFFSEEAGQAVLSKNGFSIPSAAEEK